MTVTAPRKPLHRAAPAARWMPLGHPVNRVALRWCYIGVLTAVAFRHSLANLVQVTREGAMEGYVWTVPLAAMLAATSVARRERTELPIHDRQTDVIVGLMGLVLALLLQGVLLQRYVLYLHLLRLDLLAMWVFVLSASVILFGLRPVSRFAWVWALLLLAFPLPYHLAVILLGGTRVAAGAVTLVIASFATGTAVGRTYRRGTVGAFAAYVPGGAVLAVMAYWFPDAPLLAYQQIPALIAIVVVGALLFLHRRRGAPKKFLDRKIEPLAANQVWAGLPLVFIVAMVIASIPLPHPPTPAMARFDSMSLAGPLAAPAGWQRTAMENYLWVRRLYGQEAHLTRERMVADTGNPRWDKLSRPRNVVVDTVVTGRPFSLEVYPATLIYDVTGARTSSPRDVDLGDGVQGQMFSVVDDNLLVTWNALIYAWRNDRIAQRVMIFAVDNHDLGAPFPSPTGGLWPTLNSLFTILFRGNAALDNRVPEFKDAAMLTEFGRALVRTQLHRAGPAT